MRILIAALALLHTSLIGQTIGPKNLCIPAITSAGSASLINSDMSASRSFSIDRPNLSGGFNILRVSLKLVDANTSITRFDFTCTVSDDGNTTNYTPQECTVAGGTATCVDGGVWQKASPGTKNWTYRLDISGWPDVQCTASVGAGAGAAADTIVATGMFCTE